MHKSYHRDATYSLDERRPNSDNWLRVRHEASIAVSDTKISAVILDYGEVLCFRAPEGQLRRMADVFGISVASFKTLYDKNRRAYDRGDLTPERYWFAFADEPGISLEESQIPFLRNCDVEMWSNLNPQMIAWLEDIHRHGIRTALLSNMHADMVSKVRGEFEWMRHVDCGVLSHEVNLAKPEAKIYEHCLAGLGSAASETLFIDDRETNLKAAAALGIRTIQFKSVTQLRSELDKLGFPILPEPEPAPAPVCQKNLPGQRRESFANLG